LSPAVPHCQPLWTKLRTCMPFVLSGTGWDGSDFRIIFSMRIITSFVYLLLVISMSSSIWKIQHYKYTTPFINMTQHFETWNYTMLLYTPKGRFSSYFEAIINPHITTRWSCCLGMNSKGKVSVDSGHIAHLWSIFAIKLMATPLTFSSNSSYFSK
jgi:hypothetical protein